MPKISGTAMQKYTMPDERKLEKLGSWARECLQGTGKRVSKFPLGVCDKDAILGVLGAQVLGMKMNFESNTVAGNNVVTVQVRRLGKEMGRFLINDVSRTSVYTISYRCETRQPNCDEIVNLDEWMQACIQTQRACEFNGSVRDKSYIFFWGMANIVRGFGFNVNVCVFPGEDDIQLWVYVNEQDRLADRKHGMFHVKPMVQSSDCEGAIGTFENTKFTFEIRYEPCGEALTCAICNGRLLEVK